jgi:hypothetical protein
MSTAAARFNEGRLASKLREALFCAASHIHPAQRSYINQSHQAPSGTTLPQNSQEPLHYALALARFFKLSIEVNKNLIKRGHSTAPVDYLDERTSHFPCRLFGQLLKQLRRQVR